MEGVDPNAAPAVRRLQILDQRLHGVHLQHASPSLLANRARRDGFDDQAVWDAMTGEHVVEVLAGLAVAAVLPVPDVGPLDALGHRRQHRKVVGIPHQQRVDHQRRDQRLDLQLQRSSVLTAKPSEVHKGQHIREDIRLARDVLDEEGEVLEEQSPALDNRGLGQSRPLEVRVVGLYNEELALQVVGQLLDRVEDRVGLLLRNIPSLGRSGELLRDEGNDLPDLGPELVLDPLLK